MKKRMMSILMAIAICCSLSVPAFALGTCNDTHVYILGAGYCNGDGVNIRTGPGKSYSSVGMAYYGDGFNHYWTERDMENPTDWIHVHGNHIGWIHGDYYTDVEAARSVDEAVAAAQAQYLKLGEAAKTPIVYEIA